MILGPLPMHGDALAIEPLFREDLVLVASPLHPLAQRDRVTAEDLRGAEVLSLDPRHHLHRQGVILCERYGMVLLRDYEGTSLESLRRPGWDWLSCRGFTCVPKSVATRGSGSCAPTAGTATGDRRLLARERRERRPVRDDRGSRVRQRDADHGRLPLIPIQ